jgi:FKBP-type peptidyl-prolyl cis-trans isomerase
MKQQYIALLALSLAAMPVLAEDAKPAAPAPAAPAALSAISAVPAEPDNDTVSYALGVNFGNVIKRNASDVNVETVIKAMKETIAGTQTRMTDEDVQKTLRAYSIAQRTKVMERSKANGPKNKAAAEAFFAKNATETGVKTTASGLQYIVITEGSGETAKSNDVVKVNYRGTLLDGSEFDSSYKRNRPFETVLRPRGIIPGWFEGLQLMKPGSKFKFFIPPALAYGENGNPPVIESNAALIFEVELISAEAPKPQPETAQAVSGEIIKVPGQKEREQGAKVEVIKPGQTNAPAAQ